MLARGSCPGLSFLGLFNRLNKYLFYPGKFGHYGFGDALYGVCYLLRSKVWFEDCHHLQQYFLRRQRDIYGRRRNCLGVRILVSLQH